MRCAVYTRKSSEEGLEQAFNSLHAQREACEAYITSQRHEGWILDPTPYDDGAYSGGNMQRPALQAILAAIKAGEVDVVVVYKVDRLTRSLPDFAKIVDVLDAAKASFVSVTQAFNTTTSMGRLTLNVLLSFAQFEREVTGERIRDKIAASKAKGMWMGGLPPLGYDVRDRKLIINPGEADTVRALFGRFLDSGSVDRLVVQAAELDFRTKARVGANGPTGGGLFSRGTLYHLLENRTYVGEVVHRDQSFPGEHQAIVDRDLFDRVQAVIAANRRTRKSGRNSPHPSLLASLLKDGTGQGFTPTHTKKAGKRYQYYAMRPRGQEPVYRLPASEVEGLVRNAVLELLCSPDQVIGLVGTSDPEVANQVLAEAAHLKELWRGDDPVALRQAAVTLLAGVVYRPDMVELQIRASAFGACAERIVSRHVTAHIQRRGATLKLVVDNGAPREDPKLLSIIATGEAWFDALAKGEVGSIAELAERESCSPAYVSRLIEAGLISPKLKAAIQQGTQPVRLTAATLTAAGPLPLDWRDHQAFVVGDLFPPTPFETEASQE
jgi:DNA invertase Pin-like site-specific DNA recombinase